ncbi:site-2 protease family protein [Pelagibacteraceae bacterium]|nr:site-2 protease family protein [Pelagibacteraceae bacterium]
MLTYIIPFIILILVVVFIHEYGHYYFARKYGVGVTDFSIGFGQEIFGWNDKHGTRWKICWIPLGGYVKFFGDRNVFSQADHEKILKQYNEEDILVYVQSKKSSILKRLKKRKNFNQKLLKKFKAIQYSATYKKKKSHFIIKNNFTKKSVNNGISNILKEIT